MNNQPDLEQSAQSFKAPKVGAVVLREPSALAVHSEPTLGQMMQAIIEKGITADNAAVLKTFAELKEREEARDAERKFNAAFVALQAELPVIVASTAVPNRGKYEKYEDVMKVVGPILQKHGFSVAFSQDVKENRIVQTCKLKHIGGHSEQNDFAVRASRADTDTQSDCKAATTAKRNALLNALNIVIRQDFLADDGGDATVEGRQITAAQADELERRVKETNTNIGAFLQYAKAETFKEILSGMYPVLDAHLRRKESKGR